MTTTTDVLQWIGVDGSYYYLKDEDEEPIVALEWFGSNGYYLWAPMFDIRAEELGEKVEDAAKRKALNLIRQRHGLASQMLARLPR